MFLEAFFLLLKFFHTLSLKCYYCEEPSQQIASQIWMHYNNYCRKQRVITCGASNFACVVVRVTHMDIDFTAAGCSEDRFIGCGHHQIDKNGNLTTIRRCQCSKNYCNINFDLDFGKIQPSLRPRPAISPTLAPTSTNLTILNNLAQQSSSELPIYSTASNIEETTQNLSSIDIDPLAEDINFYHIEMQVEQESKKYRSKNRNLIIDPFGVYYIAF
uniref:Protein quiver n=1 Tax=Acrobeloides nanus TaxID=290746 RepID=A0A914EG53_9BILA